MDIYAENILDHYKHPHGKVLLENPTVEHEEINHSCGDAITLQLILENGIIKELGWTGTGCAISQAGMSILSDEILGKSTKELQSLSQEYMYELLGVPIGPRRFKCALLSLHTLKNALRKSAGLEPQSWIETVSLTENQN